MPRTIAKRDTRRNRRRPRVALILLLAWVVLQAGLAVAPANAVSPAATPVLRACADDAHVLATSSGPDLSQLLARPSVCRVRGRSSTPDVSSASDVFLHLARRRIGHRPAHPARGSLGQRPPSLSDPPH
jgi:hypothetical protein